MWLFTVHGFFSVVKEGKPGNQRVMIRARKRHHLVQLVESIPHRYRRQIDGIIGPSEAKDYRWRIVVPPWLWEAIADFTCDKLSYDNFKDAAKKAHPDDKAYHAALLNVWAVMREYQNGLATAATTEVSSDELR